MTPEKTPIFDIGDTYPTIFTIGDRQLPIHIKNFNKTELAAFRQEWNACLIAPRGTAEMDPEATQALNQRQAEFIERSIADAVTLDTGVFRFRNEWVTTGRGLLDAFHARQELLTPLMLSILNENILKGLDVKNSDSPRGSEPSLAPSRPTRGGDKQGSTAGNVDDSISADHADATASLDQAADGPKVH